MRTTATEWVKMTFLIFSGMSDRRIVVSLPSGVSIFNPEYSDGGLRFSWGPDWFNNPASVNHAITISCSGRKRKYGRRVGSFERGTDRFFVYHL